MTEVRLDCLGDPCPIPIVKTRKKIENMRVGEILIIQTDHSCAMRNVPEWAEKEGYNVNVKEVDNGLWEIYLEKTK